MGRRRLSKVDRIGWVVTSIVFVMSFIAYFLYGFFANCIFNWPIRWDMGVCMKEQKTLAKQKAIEEALKFVP